MAQKILPPLTLTIWPFGDRFQILRRHHSCNHCHATGNSCLLGTGEEGRSSVRLILVSTHLWN